MSRSPGGLVRAVADRLIEAPVVTSFTSIGYELRSRLEDWTPLDRYDLSGRTALVTGATSGLGLAAAERLLRLGAHVIVLGRDRDRTERARSDLADHTGSDETSVLVADMGELDQVRDAADEVLRDHARLDALVHNAGALTADRRASSTGIELTVASQVIGPHLMTTLLLPVLRAARPGRVITVSSGGMYAAGLTVSGLEMSDAQYRGSEQYARAKRAQVTLTEMWADRVPPSDVVFHAMHPGWADTPGVESSLPRFHRLLGPVLRTPEQGVDTLVWLVADDTEPRDVSGRFWLDRQPRSIHKLPTTKRTDTPERRQALWNHVTELAGIEADDSPPNERSD